MRNIPVLHAQGNSLAEAYDNALIELYKNGIRFKTQYDKEGDPESIDATMNITIKEPMTDPMIHKAFPGGPADLREYVYELQGVKDSWVKNQSDDEDKRWEYTYHARFHRYGHWKDRVKVGAVYTDGNEVSKIFSSRDMGSFEVNQIEVVVNKLIEQPFTRQAQMITWMPNLDVDIYDPPCLQSIWYRIVEEDGVSWLNSNVRIRSNDAWGAYFMNSFGITMFNKELIADEIAKRTGKEVRLGRMNWQADSWHIYGKDIGVAKSRFFDRVDSTSFEDRVYNFNDDMIQEMYHEEEGNILKKVEEMNERFKKEYDN